MRTAVLLAGTVLLPCVANAQAFQQTSADAYTRYELLDPVSQSFRIIYDVSATAPGATFYFNGIRQGSEPTVHGVSDLFSGETLQWQIVDGPTARRTGMLNANPDAQYIQVWLARPVPPEGESRIRIDKTYRDPASYSMRGDKITFTRSLGVRRNSVLLPEGYELVRSNYPSQVAIEGNGRIRVSFMNPGPGAVSHVIEGRRLPRSAMRRPAAVARAAVPNAALTTTQTVSSAARLSYQFSERAYQGREIVYLLQPPETHSFRLYHDYTEGREGVDRYVNLVRAGSRASNPSATMLDTGEKLRVETLRGAAITARGVRTGGEITSNTEVIVIWFDPVKAGQSVRLRIEETYTDPNRYLRLDNELVWDRSFGRPRNTVVLPPGWFLTANSIPAVIDETNDGRIRLYYENDRPGNIDVFVKARLR